MRIGGGDDIDAIATDKLGGQRHQVEVDPGNDAVIADIGVHGVGQVDRRRPARQGMILPFGVKT
jgi:hypothetical protein